MRKEYCIFHDRSFYKENASQFNDAIDHEVNKAIDNRESVYCIGYHIPNIIAFRQKEIYNLLFMQGAEIDAADFSGTRFIGKDASAYFSGSIFKEGIFNNTVFNGTVKFNKSKFYSRRIKERPEDSCSGFLYEGLANFENARFFEDVDFTKAHFYGTVNFNNSRFYKYPIFDKTEFKIDMDKSQLNLAVFDYDGTVHDFNLKDVTGIKLHSNYEPPAED